MKKKMIAMLLAGGQGSRLGVLTAGVAKPAVSFGGKYRIIDFPLSNCVNSDVDTVGVLTQYRPLRLNAHIGIGSAWDLDRRTGGVFVLPPYEKIAGSDWYTGTANAIYQNMEFIEAFNPEYVVILSGDHIYKMDYEDMLQTHIRNQAALTIACMPVPWEEASRFGIMIADDTGRIVDFEEKPKNPRSNLASMGIYIFTTDVLKEALETLKDVPGCDFGKHVIPYVHQKNDPLYVYRFEGYWKDVGTLQSYWEANMGLLDPVPEFDLYARFGRIYTKTESLTPQYIAAEAEVTNSIVGAASRICGTVTHSVLGSDVIVEEGAQVTDSILMDHVRIRKGARLDKAIVAENTEVGENAVIGTGEYADSQLDQRVYASMLAVVDENSVIPAGVIVGRNTAISGVTEAADYPEGRLPSGGYIVKGGAAR